MSKGAGGRIANNPQKEEEVYISKSKYFKEAPDINKMPSYKVVDKLTVSQMEPFIDSKNYVIAHGEANYWEEKMFPKGFKELAKFDKKETSNGLSGANTPKGEIYVSKTVPEKYRQEVAYHEWVESLVRKLLRKS